jgi:multiple sugar transport system permease protein
MATTVTPARRTRPRTSRAGGQDGISRPALLLLLFLAALWLLPTFWMFITSFKDQNEAIAAVPTWLPREWTLENFDRVLGQVQNPVFRWLMNSLIAAVAHTIVVLATAAPAAYALARLEFPFKRTITAMIVATLFVPGITLLPANYSMMNRLGWLDSLVAIIVPGAAGALGVFLLRQFFISLPKELEESAMIDGASRVRIFLTIVIPLARPALATLALLVFLSNWNDFFWPLYVLFSPENLTLQPGLQTLQSAYTSDYGTIMTGAAIASVPVLVLFIISQRFIIEGVARSGIKG